MVAPTCTMLVCAVLISDRATAGSTKLAASTLSQEPSSGLLPI